MLCQALGRAFPWPLTLCALTTPILQMEKRRLPKSARQCQAQLLNEGRGKGQRAGRTSRQRISGGCGGWGWGASPGTLCDARLGLDSGSGGAGAGLQLGPGQGHCVFRILGWETADPGCGRFVTRVRTRDSLCAEPGDSSQAWGGSGHGLAGGRGVTPYMRLIYDQARTKVSCDHSPYVPRIKGQWPESEVNSEIGEISM